MIDNNARAKLAVTPINELNLGNVKLKRAIINAGFDSLIDVLDLSESDIDAKFKFDDADAIVAMQHRYARNPSEFLASVLTIRNANATTLDRTAKTYTPVSRENSKSQKTQSQAFFFRDKEGFSALPKTTSSNTLRKYQIRASKIFDALCDHSNNVMVYQAFPEFSTELNDISEAFESLFRYYGSQPRNALTLIRDHFRDVFLIFVADRARTVYSKHDLWGHFFSGIKVFDNNVQKDFKQLFASILEQRHMPLYARNDEPRYYYYTALLHGGLSGEAWSNLWQSSLLPLARDGELNSFHRLNGEINGRDVLQVISSSESDYAPTNKAVRNILEKAPEITLVPLLGDSMRVAMQVLDSRRSGLAMLSSYGLPDVAMQALKQTLSKSQETTNSNTVGIDQSKPTNKSEGARLFYLPMAKLELDIAHGNVCIRWPRQQFPSRFTDYHIDYYVAGHLEHRQPFTPSVGRCLLDAVTLAVKPQNRYDIELRLIKDLDNGGTEEQSSLLQTIRRSKPRCFEFVKDNQGTYRLRGSDERITKKRCIAYLVESGLRIWPGPGMTAIERHSADETDDNDAQIFLYEVEPGAAGSLIEISTGTEIAIWQERYSARVDRQHVIGKTAEGLDLYGYEPNDLGANSGLPSISIEALDGQKALHDLIILCTCDGKRVSIQRCQLQSSEYEDASSARIMLELQKASTLRPHINYCTIEALQISAANRAVFRYRFAVVPIRSFHPSSISLNQGTVVAEYEFQAVQDITITAANEDSEPIGAWNYYRSKALLKDESLRLRIESDEGGLSTDIRLDLAALDVKLPSSLLALSKKRPICLADAIGQNAVEGLCKIRAYGRRHDRAVYVRFGQIPLFYKVMRLPGTYEFDVLKNPRNFIQDGESPADKPLIISIYYGRDSSGSHSETALTDVKLLRCREGVGVKDWNLALRPNGTHLLQFDRAPLCSIQLDFKPKTNDRVIGSVVVEEGVSEVEIPKTVIRTLDVRKRLRVIVAPLSLFGNPEYEYGWELDLER